MSSYDESVFINCPFDSDYLPIFRGLVFAVHHCGFEARCAWEIDDSGRPRISQLYDLISECKFGIHDISRTELNDNDLPRFNMPLELGIFLGAMKFGGDNHEDKICKVLGRKPYRYQEFISDIAGQDPSYHNQEVEQAIVIVRDWLQKSNENIIMPSGSKIVDRYDRFTDELPLLCDPHNLKPESLTFIDYKNMVYVWLDENDWLYEELTR